MPPTFLELCNSIILCFVFFSIIAFTLFKTSDFALLKFYSLKAYFRPINLFACTIFMTFDFVILCILFFASLYDGFVSPLQVQLYLPLLHFGHDPRPSHVRENVLLTICDSYINPPRLSAYLEPVSTALYITVRFITTNMATVSNVHG